MLRHHLWTSALIALGAAVPSVAWAGFTTWAPTSGEPTVFEILDATYGLHNLERVNDWGVADTDEMWTLDGPTNVSVIAKYSNMNQHFGVMAGETNAMLRLMTVRGWGMGFTAEPSTIDLGASGLTCRLANDPIGDRVGSSRMSDNWRGTDQMITWRVVGNDGFGDNAIGATIVAFEDRPTRPGSIDYNDLVLELRHARGGPGEDPVPEPGTLLLLGMGAAGVAAARRRKKR